MTYAYTRQSPIGLLTLSGDGESLTGLWIEGQKYFAAGMDSTAQVQELPVFKRTQEWLDCYFSGQEPRFTPQLAPRGSAFRQAVWNELLKIPYGSVTTYGEIAKRLNASARAVGGAVGHNPISIIIPCHRVVGASGSLTGYAGGIDRKIQLLELEKVPSERLFKPKKGTAL
ncbi:MAG: methylated-DNA--[protein]-cysteine S-methyltransferase [Oscillospiraceae bacterium]|jgi:methylated-DNA-[protein]-cysteine S-methyltransferase|nr:methylated-DNA--[protein]-cysteine S-methyltransferase [Oscillospiraceae bacterium]